MMESLERRLDKLGETQAANKVFEKMISIGALEEVSAADVDWACALSSNTGCGQAKQCYHKGQAGHKLFSGGSCNWSVPKLNLG